MNTLSAVCSTAFESSRLLSTACCRSASTRFWSLISLTILSTLRTHRLPRTDRCRLGFASYVSSRSSGSPAIAAHEDKTRPARKEGRGDPRPSHGLSARTLDSANLAQCVMILCDRGPFCCAVRDMPDIVNVTPIESARRRSSVCSNAYLVIGRIARTPRAAFQGRCERDIGPGRQPCDRHRSHLGGHVQHNDLLASLRQHRALTLHPAVARLFRFTLWITTGLQSSAFARGNATRAGRSFRCPPV